MTKSSSLKPFRLLTWLAGVAVAIVGALLALNFAVVSCAPFSCNQNLSWWSSATGGSGSCPESIRGAWDDAAWAADRYAYIKDKHKTTGVFFDEDGFPHEFESGDEKGADAERARNVLRAVGAATAPDGSYPSASHVEVKVAALMREAGVNTGLLVINRENGPCPGEIGLSCQEVLSQVLASGAKLRVWFPKAGTMEYQDFQGK